jgi:hypothetical protein
MRITKRKPSGEVRSAEPFLYETQEKAGNRPKPGVEVDRPGNWFIITPGLWIGSGGTLGWICHIISAFTAYHWAKVHPP